MSSSGSPSTLFVRSAVLSLLAIAFLALPEAAFADNKKKPERSEVPLDARDEQSRASRDDRERRTPRYQHHDRFPRHIYYDQRNYYYDPPRQGITIRF